MGKAAQIAAGVVVALLGVVFITFLTNTFISDHGTRLFVSFILGFVWGSFVAQIFFVPAIFGDY